jgi:hypothetical protein
MALKRSALLTVVGIGICALGQTPPATAQAARAPQRFPAAAVAGEPALDPTGSPNIFYGQHALGADTAPVMVFVHGLSGTASDWWVGNDMYQKAFETGFRTAFVSLSRDNSRNSDSITPNAEVLRDAFPEIAAHYGVAQFYVIAHSKGGVDVQAALMHADITHLAKAVFTIATPNQGTELSNWAFGPGHELAQLLDSLLPGVLLSPGLFALNTVNMEAFRANADPFFESAGVPFYTIAGDTSAGNPVLVITGQILKNLSGGGDNDGLVTVERTHLPTSYAIDLGNVSAHHFQTLQGSVSFWKILAEIQGLEAAHGFQRIATDGFGDPDNSWPWFAKWFKGKLYIGTGRAGNCVTFATDFVQTGQRVYPPAIGNCPADYRDLKLAAEIWSYTPETRVWQRVYKSPEDVPIGGLPPKFTARDIGFRGAAVFTDPGGVEALYVSGVSASSVFEDTPPWASDPHGYPPPRILRSVDGVSWEAIPQAPGTFLGDIVKNSTDFFKVRGFRTMEVFKDQLFVTMTDYRGVGVVIGSAAPWAGNNAWRQVSPPAEELPVWTMRAFNGALYAGTGDRRENVGYGVWKTAGEGQGAFDWQPIITNGGWQANPTLRSPNVLNMMTFKNRLYVGTDRPTELVRVNPDDSWDLVVGALRFTPDGIKKPLSSINTYFGNSFNGHFWNFGVYDGSLYVGTWDWSVLLGNFASFGEPFRHQFGFDLYRTENGEDWSLVSSNGFGNPWNYGVRSLEATPFGFFVGAAKPQYGLDIWLDNHTLDLDGDGDIDQLDVNLVLQAIGEPASRPDDPRDMDRDGIITPQDATLLGTQCTQPGCDVLPGQPALPPPPKVRSVSKDLIGPKVLLYWAPVPGAVRYRVYKQPVRPILDFIPPDFSFTIPGTNITVTLDQIIAGALDFLCTGGSEGDLCALIDVLKTLDAFPVVGFPDIVRPVAITRDTRYEEDPAAAAGTASALAVGPLQSIYFVKAEDANGLLSSASNIVGGPSEGAARLEEVSPPTITATISPPPNAMGWNNTDVTVTWNLSNAATSAGCGPRVLTAETDGTTVTCTAASILGLPSSHGVTIKIDKTAPAVSFGAATPPANGAGWNNTDVSVSFTAADNLSGVGATTPADPLVVSTEGEAAFGTVTVVDAAGNSANFESPRFKIDKTPPTIAPTRSPAANAAGWNNTDVTVTFSCADALSQIDSRAPATQVVSDEGANQSRSAVAFDIAGNRAEATVGGINIDKTPPLISAARTPDPNAAGWNNTDVTVTFACADALSQVGSCGPSPQVVSTEGTNQSRQGVAVDLAGNSAPVTLDGINIDKTPPVIVAAPNPPPNSEGWNNTDVTVSFTATDDRSGVASVSHPVTLKGEGASQVVNGAAFDRAGNTAVTTAAVNIDKTPPEALLQVDAASRNLVARGRDPLSGPRPGAFPPLVPVGSRPDRQSYLVLDRAGNTLKLVVIIRRALGELKGRIESLQYGSSPPIMVPANQIKASWVLAQPNVFAQLHQDFIAAPLPDGQRVRAKFSALKNVTVVLEGRGNENQVTLPGLHVLQMGTEAGTLRIEVGP